MAVIRRFPENLDGNTDPWILFTTQSAQYKRRNRSVGDIDLDSKDGNSVALYFPTSHTINDNINYESFEEGFTGFLVNRMLSGGARVEDVTNIDFGESAAAVGRTSLRNLSSVRPGGSVVTRNQGRVTNPREFMMFKSPGIRTFSFSFTFIPQSKSEADSVPEIIKFFRSAAYPEETPLEYIFPDTFNITYQQANEGIIKIPELACTSVSVVYNPNSISFFKNNGMPVETTLELSFTELRPVNRTLVEEGY